MEGKTKGWRQGEQKRERQQQGQEIDEREKRLGLDQGPDHATEGVGRKRSQVPQPVIRAC